MRPRVLAQSAHAIRRHREAVVWELAAPVPTSLSSSSDIRKEEEVESLTQRIEAVRRSMGSTDPAHIPSLCNSIRRLALLPTTQGSHKIDLAQQFVATSPTLDYDQRIKIGGAVLEVIITVDTLDVVQAVSTVVEAAGDGFMSDLDPSLACRVADVVLGLLYANGKATTPPYLEGVPSKVLIDGFVSRGLLTTAQNLLVRYPEPIATRQDWLPVCMKVVSSTTTSEGVAAGYDASVALSGWSRLLPAHVAAGWVLNAAISGGSLQAALGHFTTLLKRRVLISWQPAVRLIKECAAHGISVDEFVEASMWSLPLSARLISTLATTHPWNALRLLEAVCIQNPSFTLNRQTTRVEVRAVLALIWDRSASDPVYRWLLQEMELFVQPWRCYSCFGFNKGHTFTCVRCHSIAPPWQCTCGTWNTGGGVSCRQCSGSIDNSQWKGENAVHWTCEECTTKNASSLSSCKTCGGGRKSITVRDRSCGSCSKDLSRAVEPWCDGCGWISSDDSTSLWRCLWCKRLNPWTACACRFCKEPNYGAAPTVKWFQWVCPGCSYNQNPAWSNRCHSCDDEHDPIGTTRPKCRLCESHMSEDLKCPNCGLGSERWMCLHSGCLTINEEFAASCVQCSRKRADLAMVEDLVLGYTVDEPTLRMRAARVPATPPRNCKGCGTKLPCGVLQVCPKCSLPEITALPRAAHWKLLGLLSNSLQADKSSHPTVMLTAPIVDKAEQDKLPWRGRDLESGLLCVSKDNPVYRDGTTHSSLNTIRESMSTLVKEAQTATGPTRTGLLKSALQLLTLVNSTTRFDELGFDVVWPLLVAVRGGSVDADTEVLAKHEYLMEMKLGTDFILGKVVCPTCLGRAPCTRCHKAL